MVSTAAIVKLTFNALVQASMSLKNCPNDIDVSYLVIGLSELRDHILKAHKPIDYLFFTYQV